MIVFQTPYSGYNNGISTGDDGTTSIRIPATPAAIEALANLPHVSPRKSLLQIKATFKNSPQPKPVAKDILDDVHDDGAPEVADDEYEIVKTISEKRISHFYYLLVAYYDAQCSPVRAKPKLSPGKLRNPNSCAHVYPSLYPRIKDNYFNNIRYHTKNQSIDEKMQRIMEALCAKLTEAALTGTSPPGGKILDNLGTMRSLLSRDCELYTSLHQTIEAPFCVAEYNELIENVADQLTEDLFEGCDKGKIKPYSGCTTFVKRLSEWLEKSYLETKDKISLVNRCQDLYNIIRDSESKVLNEDSIVVVDYLKATFELLQLMNTLSTQKNSLSVLVELSSALRERQEYFLWMVTFLMNEINYVVGKEKPSEFEKLYKSAIARIEKYQEQDGELVNVPKRTMSIDEQKDRLLNCDIIDYCLADGKRRRDFPGDMSANLRQYKIPSLPKINFDAEVASLMKSQEINRWMQESNVMPDKESLSGVHENNKLRPMTNEELFTQKLTLIARK